MSKCESKMLAGIAIILMIILHVMAGNLFEHKSILLSDDMITSFARFGKICVSVYAFLSGYGMWTKYMQFNKNLEIHELIAMILKRIRNFYSFYFPIVVLVAVIKFPKEGISYVVMLKNIIGLSWSYNAAWWYVRYYLIMVIVLFPVSVLFYQFIMKKGISKKLGEMFDGIILFLLVLLSIVIGIKKPGVPCLFVFVTGELCAKYDLIARIRGDKYCIIAFMIGLIIRLIYTNENGLLMLDLICVPAMVPLVLNIISNNIVGKLLYLIGMHSTTMWLTHSFLYSGKDWIKAVPTATIGMPIVLMLSFLVAFIWDSANSVLRTKLFIKE